MTQLALADSFLDAVTRLEPRDMKRTAAFVKRLTGESGVGGYQFEIIHDAKDRTIRSARVSGELRVIAHVDSDRILLLYVDHHDAAYEWARNRCVECHPVTGELQVIEAPAVAMARLGTGSGPGARVARPAQAPPGGPTFGEFSDEYLLSLGVPPSWLPTLRMVRSDEMFLSIADGLPEPVAERLLRLAEGELVPPPEPVCAEDECEWTTPGARRWICEVSDAEGLCRVLDDAGIEHGLRESDA
jgi:mRNA-degrading endonuclease RelE of RelBE toxin-antitoxin system